LNQELGACRVTHHPILGEQPRGTVIQFTFDGRELPALEGEPILAALAAQGIRLSRTTSRRGEKRWFFCGIGLCTDCMMIVDGVPSVRTCVTPVREGTRVEIQHGVGAWEADAGHD
jgi:predicted molibdopterin-dependent oxidoreductase YjgC